MSAHADQVVPTGRGGFWYNARMDNTRGATRGISGLDGLLLGLVVIWGVNFSILKVGLDTVPAQVFNGVRMGLAAVVFVALLAAQRRLGWRRGDGWRIIGLGLLGHGGYQILFIEGLHRTAVGNTSLILASVPLWVALLGLVSGMERPPRRAWGGLGLAFAGVLVVILGTNQGLNLPGLSSGADSGASLLGDALVLGATLCWAAYTAFSQPLLTRYSPTQLTGLTLVAACPVLLGAALWEGSSSGWGAWTPGAVGAVLFGGLLSVNLCYVIWYAGVQRLGGARTAVFSNVTPLVAILSAWLWRGEPLQPVYLLGAVLIAGGVLLARFSRPAPVVLREA
jgi:drug/metabolite transporter (DMT)-like permease